MEGVKRLTFSLSSPGSRLVFSLSPSFQPKVRFQLYGLLWAAAMPAEHIIEEVRYCTSPSPEASSLRLAQQRRGGVGGLKTFGFLGLLVSGLLVSSAELN